MYASNVVPTPKEPLLSLKGPLLSLKEPLLSLKEPLLSLNIPGRPWQVVGANVAVVVVDYCGGYFEMERLKGCLWSLR